MVSWIRHRIMNDAVKDQPGLISDLFSMNDAAQLTMYG
jgi:hypothetical protein